MKRNNNLPQREWREFNFNDSVLVKLSATGIELREDFHYKKLGLAQHKISLEIDENGYTEFQLYNIMQIFGDSMTNGNDKSPFENMNFKMQIENTKKEITDTLNTVDSNK